MHPLNISNFSLSSKIGFLSLDNWILDSRTTISTIYQNIAEKLNIYTKNKDVVIISNVYECINILDYAIDLNDIMKNIMPYDFVLYFMPLNPYSMKEITSIIEKVQVKTGCSSVDLSLSHYFYDLMKKNDELNYIKALDVEYNMILDGLKDGLYEIYDGILYENVIEYVNKISDN